MRYLSYGIKALHPKKFYYLTKHTSKDFLPLKKSVESNNTHLSAAMKWLSVAQKQNNDGGVAALYSLFDGWADSYIETTGYIASTFFNYAELTNNQSFKDKAIEMMEFELKKQLPDGGFEGGRGEKNPVTFNTGQVIFGLCRAYKETKQEKYREAAKKAGELLISAQDKTGCFKKHLYKDYIHTYNTRTAWSMLYISEITNEKKFENAAKKNFDWALTQQLDNGFYQNNAFYPEQEPLVHTIAYAIRGLLEAGLILNEKKYFEAAEKAAEKMLQLQRKDGSLAGSFNEKWKSSVKWSCLTGNSQMSIIWQKIFLKTNENEFLKAAKKANEYNKRTQILSSKNPGIKGAIAGAYPIYGWYAPFCYINWGTKFFADALMLEENPKLAEKIDS